MKLEGRLSMEMTRVIVLPYDAKWKTDFENIRKEIVDAVGGLCRSLYGASPFDYLSSESPQNYFQFLVDF